MIVGPTGIRMSKSTRLLYKVTFGSSPQARQVEQSRTVPIRRRLMLMPSSDRVCLEEESGSRSNNTHQIYPVKRQTRTIVVAKLHSLNPPPRVKAMSKTDLRWKKEQVILHTCCWGTADVLSKG